MPFTKSNIYYRQLNAEADTVLVFLHGLGSSSSVFVPVATELSADYSCLLVDSPGCGRSGLEGECVSIKEIGSCVLLVVEELGLERRNLVLVGHAMAAMVVAYLAAENNDGVTIAGCVMLSPLVPDSRLRQQLEQRIEVVRTSSSMEEVAELAVPTLGAKSSLVERAFVRELLVGQDPKGYAANCAAIVSSFSHKEQFEGYYGAITVPVLLISGTEEPSASLEGLSKVIPNSKTVALDGVGHWAQVEAYERVAAEIRQFVADLQA